MNDKTLELFHHGIRKQRWGVRNGPPYPLDRKTHSRIVRGKQDKELKRYSKKKTGISHLGDQWHRKYEQLEDFSGIRRHFGFDDPENKAAGVHDVRTYGDASSRVNLATIIGRGGDDEKAWRTLDRPGHRATAEDLITVNAQRRYQGPNAHQDGFLDPGLSNNCGMCSAAMFLRGLGYEVQAGRTSSGVKNSAYQSWFDGAKTYKTKGAQALYQQLSSFGNQGKGVINIRHKNGSGHSVYFQMEKQADGRLRPTVYDGQIAKKYSSLSEFLRAENADMSQFTQVTRLDGSTPNWKHLAEDGAIRANLSYLTGDESDRSRGIIRDHTKGQDYDTDHFTFVDDAFTKDNWREIDMAKSGTWWTDNETGDIWRRPAAYVESLAQAEKDRQAREYLKTKWKIGG